MWSHEPDDYVCPFCAYAAGAENEVVQQRHLVERAPETITFVSPRWWPNNAGHVIVVPTTHVENLYTLSDHLGGSIVGATRRAATAMKVAYGCEGTSTRQHNEPAGNQEVWHLHVHVFPRYEGDALYESHGSRADPDAMAEHADRLRAAYRELGFAT